jgi:hypothetical protein
MTIRNVTFILRTEYWNPFLYDYCTITISAYYRDVVIFTLLYKGRGQREIECNQGSVRNRVIRQYTRQRWWHGLTKSCICRWKEALGLTSRSNNDLAINGQLEPWLAWINFLSELGFIVKLDLGITSKGFLSTQLSCQEEEFPLYRTSRTLRFCFRSAVLPCPWQASQCRWTGVIMPGPIWRISMTAPFPWHFWYSLTSRSDNDFARLMANLSLDWPESTSCRNLALSSNLTLASQVQFFCRVWRCVRRESKSTWFGGVGGVICCCCCRLESDHLHPSRLRKKET